MGKRRKPAPGKPESKPAAKQRRREPPAKGAAAAPPEEFGGPPGPEPTRYGDWQIKGRVSDF